MTEFLIETTLSSLAFLTMNLKDNLAQETRLDNVQYCTEQSGLSLNGAYLIPLRICLETSCHEEITPPPYLPIHLFQLRHYLQNQAFYQLDSIFTPKISKLQFSPIKFFFFFKSGWYFSMHTLVVLSSEVSWSTSVCGCTKDPNAWKLRELC